MVTLIESLKFGIAGAIQHPQVDMTKVNYSQQPWALEPTQMIAYVSCHDDMCLVDRLRASIPSLKGDDELIRLTRVVGGLHALAGRALHAQRRGTTAQ